MKTDTEQKILRFIENQIQVSVQDLIRYLGFSPQAIHRQLKKLIFKDKLEKIGTPPRVYYQLKQADSFLQNNTKTSATSLSKNQDKNSSFKIQTGNLSLVKEEVSNYKINNNSQINSLIIENFVQILPNGQELTGLEAFQFWCWQRNFRVDEYAKKYQEILTKYNSYKNNQGLIEATHKLVKTYQEEIFLDKLWYLDFSAYEIFGKTKTYTYLLYSKLNEDQKMMVKIFERLRLISRIEKLIHKNQIQAVGFVPPTVPRRVQFQTELEKYLNLNLPKISIYKLKTPVLVPQKTLSLPKERIINSQTTFVVAKTNNFQKILLIDDFAGSGATLNYIAQKIRQKNTIKDCKIYGLALCGTPNGVVDNSQKFEVVKEV